MLRSGHGRTGCRFEVLDLGLNVLFDLEGVLEAVVQQDVDDDIKQQLSLKMLPEDRLRNMTFRRYVKAYFRVGMPDQTEIEYPLGVYLWATPSRELETAGSDAGAEGVTTWTVTLGDRSHLLDLGGPNLAGYSVRAGARVTYELRRILARMGMDTSGVVASDETLGRGVLFDLRVQSDAAKKLGVNLESSPVTWLRVMHRLSDAIGYNSVFFDGDGLPILKPAPDTARVPADVTFETSADSIIVPPATVSREIEGVANRVTIRNQAPGGNVQTVTVDANKYLPSHPMAAKNLAGGGWDGFIDVVLEEPLALSISALRARAIRVLQRRLSCLQTVTVKTLAWPVHEAFDVVALQWDGDEDYDATTFHHEKAWTLDLFTGEMTHTLRRSYRAE